MQNLIHAKSEQKPIAVVAAATYSQRASIIQSVEDLLCKAF